MLRYSLLLTALCVACMTSSPLIRLYFWLGLIGAHVARMRRNLWLFAVMRLRSPLEARGRSLRESRRRFAERLPSSRAEDWRLRARALCNPPKNFRSQARWLGRSQRPQLRPRFRGLVWWSRCGAHPGAKVRDRPRAPALRIPLRVASRKAA